MTNNLTWKDLPESIPLIKKQVEIDDLYDEYMEEFKLKDKMFWPDKPKIFVPADLIRHNYNKPFLTGIREYNISKLPKMKPLIAEVQKLLDNLLEAGEKYQTEFGILPTWKHDLTESENNKRLEDAGYANFKYKFAEHIEVFPRIYFKVTYGQIKNQNPYFATSIVSNSEFASIGQSQERTLNKNDLAYKFYKHWNRYHTQTLTIEEFQAMRTDLNKVISRYDGKNYEE